MDSRQDLVLLYDGVCGFCNRTVQVILARDRVGSMRFAPLQSEFAKEILARHPELCSVDSLILVKEAGKCRERVHVRSDAVLEVAAYLGVSRVTLWLSFGPFLVSSGTEHTLCSLVSGTGCSAALRVVARADARRARTIRHDL